METRLPKGLMVVAVGAHQILGGSFAVLRMHKV